MQAKLEEISWELLANVLVTPWRNLQKPWWDCAKLVLRSKDRLVRGEWQEMKSERKAGARLWKALKAIVVNL